MCESPNWKMKTKKSVVWESEEVTLKLKIYQITQQPWYWLGCIILWELAFDVGEDEAAPEVHVFRDPDPFGEVGFPDVAPVPVHSTPAPATPSLTEEQRKRMEMNRQRALERRLARQQPTGRKNNVGSAPVLVTWGLFLWKHLLSARLTDVTRQLLILFIKVI